AKLCFVDLPAVLKLAETPNVTVSIFQERVNQAYARLQQAKVLWLPSLSTGPAYQRHDGLLQNSNGQILKTNNWNFFYGGGAALQWDSGEAIFAPLVARRLLQAQDAEFRTQLQQLQLEIVLAYYDLVEAYGRLAIATEALSLAEEMLRQAEGAEFAGLGK